MTERARIKVTMGEDGKTPRYELVYEDRVIGEMSYLDVVELSSQAPGTLRFETEKKR